MNMRLYNIHEILLFNSIGTRVIRRDTITTLSLIHHIVMPIGAMVLLYSPGSHCICSTHP